jgi:4-amino-4-deoxy-L-arabinose transferase-like glycosyltransferase
MATRFSPRDRIWLILIVVLYAILGITYSLATPPLEASDEFKHYPVVQFIETERRLPVLDPAMPGLWRNEAGQPPLYYALMAFLTAPIDTTDLTQLHQLNAHAFIGDPNQISNRNLIIHDPAREQFPWQGAVLAIHLIRLVSIAFGIGTIILTAQLGRLLFNPRVGLLGAALTAFNPMFLFVSAAVNNDSLAIMLGHLGLLMSVWLWQDLYSSRASWGRYAGLGAVIGLGMLTKLSLVPLLGLAGAALALLALRHRDWRFLFLGGTLVLTIALAISGWWFVRNLTLYGDLTGVSAFISAEGVRGTSITWQDWKGEFGTFYRSYWGLFGAVNIATPEPYYLISNAAMAIGAVGFAIWWVKNRQRRAAGLWLVVMWGLALLLLLLKWNVMLRAFQGRLVFPALGGLNVLWVMGLVGGIREKWGRHLSYLLVGWFFAAAALLPWTVIRAAYAYPEPLSRVPDGARFGPIAFQAADGEIRLVGAEVAPGQTVQPAGQPVEVVLYWQAADPVESDYLGTVHLLGRDHVSVGQVNRYPAGGMIPTSRWQKGQIWRDVYHVSVAGNALAPTRLRVDIGLYDTDKQEKVPATGPDGSNLDLVVVGEAKLVNPAQAPEPPTRLAYTFADGITLTGYDIVPEKMELTLYWEASDAPSGDYTVFVHLLDAEGEIWGQGDGPPVDGDYPTSLWASGETIVDRHTISVQGARPPGTYHVVVGLYRPGDATRLMVWDADGAEQQDARIILPDPLAYP